MLVDNHSKFIKRMEIKTTKMFEFFISIIRLIKFMFELVQNLFCKYFLEINVKTCLR